LRRRGDFGPCGRSLHERCLLYTSGNLTLGDGSVQSATIAGLHTYLENGTNTVAMPVFNFFY